MRSSHALESTHFSFCIIIKSDTGVTGSPLPIPISKTSCLEKAPTSKYKSSTVSTFSLGVCCLRAMTPFMFWPSRVSIFIKDDGKWRGFQPPTGWTCINPRSSIFLTKNPISSTWAVNKTLNGLSPFWIAIKLPNPSYCISSAYSSKYVFINLVICFS